MSENIETSPTASGGAWSTIVSSVGYIARFLGLFNNPATSTGAILALLVPVFSTARALWSQLFQYMDQLAVTTFGNVEFQPLGFANYLLPLDWFCTQLAVWFGVYVLTSIIRIVKSFIPTVA